MFYDKFKNLCDQRGISCNKAALEIGLSNAAVPKWKKTGYTPRGDTLSKIANYFEISISELLGEENKKAPTDSGERQVNHEDIKFALFGGDGEITDAMYEEVRNFAEFVKQREAEKRKG